MSDASKSVEIILRGSNQLGPVFAQAGQSMRGFADGTIGNFRRVTSTVLNLNNLIAAGAAGMAAKAVFAPAIEVETARMQFEVLLGSADAARQRLKELSDFAAATPYELPGITKASRTLQVMTNGALATQAGLRMVGDVAAAANQPIEELAVWFGRLWSNVASNRPAGEALMRLQELGVMSGDLRGRIEALQAANANSRDVWDAVTQGMDRYRGMMEKLAQTTQGRMSTLGDAWREVRQEVGETALPVLKGAVEGLIAELNRLQGSGQLREWGEDARDALKTLWEVTSGLASFVKDHGDTISTLGMTYAGAKVILAAATAVGVLRTALIAEAAAQTAAAAATNAHTAAMVAQQAAAPRLATGLGAASNALLTMRGLLLSIGPAAVAAGVALDGVLAAKLYGSLGDIGDARTGAGMKKRGRLYELKHLWDSSDIETGPASDDDVYFGRKAAAERRDAERAAQHSTAPGMSGDAAAQAALDNQLDAELAAFNKEADAAARLSAKRIELLDQLADMEADAAARTAAGKIDAEIEAERRAQARLLAERDQLLAEAEAHARAAAQHMQNYGGLVERYNDPGGYRDSIRDARHQQREDARMQRRAEAARERAEQGLPVTRKGRYAMEVMAERAAGRGEMEQADWWRGKAGAKGDEAGNAGLRADEAAERAKANAAAQAKQAENNDRLDILRQLGMGPFMDAFGGGGPAPLLLPPGAGNFPPAGVPGFPGVGTNPVPDPNPILQDISGAIKELSNKLDALVNAIV